MKVFGLGFHPQCPNFIAAGADDRVQLWDVTRAQCVGNICITLPNNQTTSFGGPRNEEAKSYVFCLSFSPDGQLLATAGSDGNVVLLNTATMTVAAILPGIAPVTSVDFAPTGDAVVLTAQDGTTALWDLRMMQKRIEIPQAHEETAYQVSSQAFSRNEASTNH